jgi:hypothetical protein
MFYQTVWIKQISQIAFSTCKYIGVPLKWFKQNNEDKNSWNMIFTFYLNMETIRYTLRSSITRHKKYRPKEFQVMTFKKDNFQ